MMYAQTSTDVKRPCEAISTINRNPDISKGQPKKMRNRKRQVKENTIN